jgi:hypothetical protein
MKILINSSVASLLLLSTGSTLLAACAHAQSAGAIENSSAKEPSDMTSTYRAYKPSEHPEVTPEELSRRVIKLLAALNSVDELSAESLTRDLMVPVVLTPSRNFYSFRIELPESGWSYGVAYRDPTLGAKRKVLRFDFLNKEAGRDPAPVCGLPLGEFIAGLDAAGYYGGPERGEIGQVEAYSYRRGQVDVLIGEWPTAVEGRSCLSYVSVHRAD